MTDTSKLGFFIIDRALWDHQIFKASEMSEREAWLWMISAAAWAETTHRVGSDIVPVPRGSFMVTLREMQRTFGWSSDTRVRNYLKKLEKCEMVSIVTLGQRNARKTHVSICNYTKYQSPQRSENAAKTQQKRSKNAAKKEDNNITTKRDTNVSPKNDGLFPDDPPPKKANKRKTAIPKNWVMSDKNREYALSQKLTPEQANDEERNFRDYNLAKDNKYADWDAAWRTWVRNSIKFASNRSQPRRAVASHDPHESTRRVLREIEANAQRGGNDRDGRLEF